MWKRNTVFVGLGIALAALPVYVYSNTVMYQPNVRPDLPVNQSK